MVTSPDPLPFGARPLSPLSGTDRVSSLEGCWSGLWRVQGEKGSAWELTPRPQNQLLTNRVGTSLPRKIAHLGPDACPRLTSLPPWSHLHIPRPVFLGSLLTTSLSQTSLPQQVLLRGPD